MQKIWRSDGVKIWLVFSLWLGLILGMGYFWTTKEILPFSPSYLLSERLEEMDLPVALRRMGGFDGVHYLTLVESGYGLAGGTQAFFPLYPLLVRGVNQVIRQPVLSGILLAVVSFLGFLWLSFKLIKAKFSRQIAWWWVIIYLFSPASFFLVSFYTESLFLLLLMATFWAYERKKFWLVALFGALLAATRVIGIIAPVALCFDYLYHAWKSKKLRKKAVWQDLAVMSLSSLGLVSFMIYLWQKFGDPLYFMSVQSAFGAGRETSHLTLLPQVFWRYGKMFFYGLPWDWKTFAIGQELVMSVIYLLGLAVTGWQNWRAKKPLYPWSWWFFSVGAFLVPTLTGNFSSMPRYVLPCLVVTLLIAKMGAKKPLVGVLMMMISGGVMLVNLLLFLQGFWVA